jgi:hypothetical protein
MDYGSIRERKIDWPFGITPGVAKPPGLYTFLFI